MRRASASVFGVEDDPVTEDRQEEVLDVDRGDVRAIVEERPAARGPLERGSRDGRADRHSRRLAGRAHELDDPAPEQRVEVDVAHRGRELLDLLDRHDRLERGECGAPAGRR